MMVSHEEQTWHLSKHVSQSTQHLPVQFQSAVYEGVFQEEVHPYPLRHGCWDKNTQILKYKEAEVIIRLSF